MNKRTTEYLTLGVLLIVSSVLILANLGNVYLWQDEAQTALLARSILSHGPGLEYLVKNVPWDKYERLVLPYPDTDFENREDPDEHYFRTPQDMMHVQVFHRIWK